MKPDHNAIIPMPKSTAAVSDERVLLPARVDADPQLTAQAAAFCEYLERLLNVVPEKGTDGIRIATDAALGVDEYRIEISASGAVVLAGGEEGITYALSTILQLAECKNGMISLPEVVISDRPDCGYRALMIDLARKWHPFYTLKGYVDICYLYKIKYLHLHFIDNQSYTLPSKAFPKMPTEGRHYTREEITELNEYARAHGIELIPEMEVPGHAAAMVKAYTELFADTPVGIKTKEEFVLVNETKKPNIICVGKPGIMDTLRTLASEIIEMFPYSRYLHIGGDEARISDWSGCRDCLAYMEKHGINGVRPLYTHFVKLMTDMVLELGRTPIVWEGFPREGSEEISRKVIVTAWESYYHLAPELLEEGFTITNASWQPLYIVPKGHRVVTEGSWTPDEILDWNIYRWQNWNPKTAAHKSPIDVSPTDKVLGATLCAWEDVYEAEIGPVKRNLTAMSEKVWNVSSSMSKEAFYAALTRLEKMADLLVSQHKERGE